MLAVQLLKRSTFDSKLEHVALTPFIHASTPASS